MSPLLFTPTRPHPLSVCLFTSPIPSPFSTYEIAYANWKILGFFVIDEDWYFPKEFQNSRNQFFRVVDTWYFYLFFFRSLHSCHCKQTFVTSSSKVETRLTRKILGCHRTRGRLKAFTWDVLVYVRTILNGVGQLSSTWVGSICTVQPKNNARARISFCVRKPATSCGYLRDAFAWILQAARTSLRLGADYMRRAAPLSRAGSVWRDLGTSLKHTKNQLRDYMEKFQPG